jgi:predicted ribonuclease YlaK
MSNKYRNTSNIKKVKNSDLVSIIPKTLNQSKVFTEYEDGQHLILHGVAGSGKTFLSLYLALNEILDSTSYYNDITIVRSIVPTRDIGFLPGPEEDKLAVYEAPYKAVCGELFLYVKEAYESLKYQGVVKFMSTSFVRGITLTNSIVIVDECQNLTFHELDSIITRIGEHSKIIFCGDYTQTDFIKASDKTGLGNFIKIANRMPQFSIIEFGVEDIVRSDFLKSYIIEKNNLGL